MSTRLAILSSWHAARRKADVDGVVRLTASSFAGYALERAEGDPVRAHGFVPTEIEAFWGRVGDALDQVAQEEALPQTAAGGQGR